MSRKATKKYMTKSRKITQVSVAMSALGRVGGLARAEKLSAEERRASAIKASKAAAKARTAKATERQKNDK
jgi:hypothetical protein